MFSSLNITSYDEMTLAANMLKTDWLNSRLVWNSEGFDYKTPNKKRRKTYGMQTYSQLCFSGNNCYSKIHSSKV